MFKINTQFLKKKKKKAAPCFRRLRWVSLFPRVLFSSSLLSRKDEQMRERVRMHWAGGREASSLGHRGHHASSPQTLRKNDANEPDSDFVNHTREGGPGRGGASSHALGWVQMSSSSSRSGCTQAQKHEPRTPRPPAVSADPVGRWQGHRAGPSPGRGVGGPSTLGRVGWLPGNGAGPPGRTGAERSQNQ